VLYGKRQEVVVGEMLGRRQNRMETAVGQLSTASLRAL
jgi:hypothetical protein